MFIRNIDNTKLFETSKYYDCSPIIGKYLIKQGIPEFSRRNGNMVFKKTKKLQKAIDGMPFYLKFLIKAGVING